MKLLFLDIDGVVVTNADLKNAHPDGYYWFNETLVNRLKLLLEKTGAKIVVSSSWRSHNGDVEQTKEILKRHGLGNLVYHIIGQTGGSDHGWRGLEIRDWMHKNLKWDYETRKYSDLESYVIVDDDSDMLYEHRKNFVQTSMKNGLTEKLLQKAIKILGELEA